MRENFQKYFDIINNRYNYVDTIADNLGNPKFIPMKGFKETAENIIKKIEEGSLEPFMGKQMTYLTAREFLNTKVNLIKDRLLQILYLIMQIKRELSMILLHQNNIKH